LYNFVFAIFDNSLLLHILLIISKAFEVHPVVLCIYSTCGLRVDICLEVREQRLVFYFARI